MVSCHNPSRELQQQHIFHTVETMMNAVTTSGSYNTYAINIHSNTNKMIISASNPRRFNNSSDKAIYPNNAHKGMGHDSDDMVNLNEIGSVILYH